MAALQGLAVGAALAGSLSLARAQGAAFETPPSLPGTRIVPAALLKGPGHEVAEPIAIDRFLGSFELRSAQGTFRVRGAEMLAQRVAELGAIDELRKVRGTSAFTDALAKSAAAPVRFVGSLVTDPTATVENVAAGAGSVLGRVGYSVKSGIATAGEAVTRSQASGQPASRVPAADEPPSFTGDPLGYNQARREWARKLGVDPYTSNPVLRPLLDDAAAATFAGSFAVNVTVGAVAAPLRYAGELDATARESAWHRAPLDLARENEQKLRRMGVPADVVRAYLGNRWYTPTLQTALVEALERLGGIAGRDAVVRSASTIAGEVPARFLLRSVALLADHHRKRPLSRIATRGIVPFAHAKDGSLVAAAAIDHLHWDEEAAAFADANELAARNRVLLLGGSASARAGRELERLGWSVRMGLASTRG